ncbi:MAG: hypothetical protein V4727_08190 [Verrucomicrobiota bacterium]
MKSKILSRSVLATLLLGVVPLHAAETTVDPKAQTTVKRQVGDSMIGYRDTLLFYTFAAEKAVLVVKIDDKSDKFPMNGKLYIFAKETTAEGLDKWINNQHSDGLYPDVPEPVTTHEIPAASFSLVSQKMAEVVKKEHAGTFNRHEVEFKVENVPAFGEIKIKDFTDTATVHIKSN